MSDTCKTYLFWALVDKKSGVVLHNQIFDSRSSAREAKRVMIDGDEFTVKRIKVSF